MEEIYNLELLFKDEGGANKKITITNPKEGLPAQVALDNFKVLDPAAGSGAFPIGMLQQLLKTYERIGTRFDPYKLKLSIIENNIFGVDIQPMAVEISRLRVWLSVIVDETDKNNIKPLPNLEFKFVAANSLVKLEDSQTSLFVDPDLDIKLQDLRNKYFNARSIVRKQEYQDKYYKLTLGQANMFEDERTQQLKTFDPFKNRTIADFFDPNIMFGITSGFDAVIGNPPYIPFQDMELPLRNYYKNNVKKLGFTTYAASGDIYGIFYEKGIQLLKEGGILSFITSNKWMRANYGKNLRDYFISETNPINLIDLGAGIFESATVDTNILIIQKASNNHSLKAITLGKDSSDNMSDYIRQNAVSIDYRKGESWIIMTEIELSIKQKIEAIGTPLKDWNISINYGIKTGLNDAFIISKETRDKLIELDINSAEIIRPILRGRDIKRYKAEFRDLYLINTHNGYTLENGKTIPPINIEDYPAIKEWLENGTWNTKPNKGTNFERLSVRTDQGVTPYNLRSLVYMEDFFSRKIVYPNMTKFLPFFLDEENYFTNQKAFIITGENLGSLVAFCNSSLFKFIYSDNFPELQGGTRELSKVFFERLFVKKVDNNSEESYLKIIKEIQNLKRENKDTTVLEKSLDNMIFEEYQLSSNERNIILNSINPE